MSDRFMTSDGIIFQPDEPDFLNSLDIQNLEIPISEAEFDRGPQDSGFGCQLVSAVPPFGDPAPYLFRESR
jgi:hypothetical protein